MNDMHDVWAHPQLQARDRWTEVDDAGRADPGAAAARAAERVRAAHGSGARARRSTPTRSCASSACDDGEIARLRAENAI